MSKTRPGEWEKLCLNALSETNLERRKAIVLELGRILHAGVYHFGPLRVDVERAEVTRNGTPVHLSSLEFRLLRYFIERPGAALARAEILRSVWGYHSHTFTRTLDVHVGYLRQKLEQDPKRPKLIVTVPRVGYMLLGLQTRARSA